MERDKTGHKEFAYHNQVQVYLTHKRIFFVLLTALFVPSKNVIRRRWKKWLNSSSRSILFFKNGPILASFSIYFRLFNTLQFKLKLKKRRWCAWDSNLGWQDGRRKRIHSATVAQFFSVNTYSLATYWKRHTYEVAILGDLLVDAKD